jgi:hypothetical protein
VIRDSFSADRLRIPYSKVIPSKVADGLRKAKNGWRN